MKKTKSSRKNNKALIIGICIAVAVVCVAVMVIVGITLKKKADADKEAKLKAEKEEKERIERQTQSSEAFEKYMSYVPDKKYDDMYNMLDSQTKTTVDLESFKQQCSNFYDEINMASFTVDNVVSKDISDAEPEKVVIDEEETKTSDSEENDEKNIMIITYSTSIATAAGDLSFDNEAQMVKEGDAWLLDWNIKLVYPQLTEGDVVDYQVTEPVRGTIYDRDGNALAENKSSGSNVRNYPVANKASHLVGFVHKVTEDEIKERGADKYDKNSLIGKKGLEYAFEEKLRGKPGCKIAIKDSTGAEKQVIAQVDAQNGEDLKTTIDMDVQTAIYNQIQSENACSVAINPYTGEILAMLSTPAYDNNGLYAGTASDTYNRFARKFCPGSTFKSITAAIGLDCGAFTADEDFGASTTKWQKDSSWGNLYITTQHACSVATLINGITLSDNVYFAKAALKIGGKNLKAGLDKIGFNEDLPIEMNFAKSQYSNSDGFSSEGMLANSGYGQGEILVNPLHMASIYSAFLNDGNMVKPCFQYEKTEFWKEGAFTAETANKVKECLINVVNSAEGTGHPIYRDGLTLGGKTGTAEIKQSQNDENGTELGWFIVFTPDVDKEKAVLIVTMIEDVKNRNGSAYVVNKSKGMIDALY